MITGCTFGHRLPTVKPLTLQLRDNFSLLTAKLFITVLSPVWNAALAH